MSFVDKVAVTVTAGKGGDGRLSFRREKFIDRGGPDGGDGGDGGDVVAVASRNQNTLANFRYKKELQAEAGGAGGKQRKHGKRGQDLLVPLPVGTMVSNDQGEVIVDLRQDGQQAIIAHGGKGGFGNAHFVSSTRQAPRLAEKGEPGEQQLLTFELKMIADVGLVGLPNAGKSTLLSVISNARPDIADYPFTTLVPNLGVADIDNESLLFADIPGLISGAAAGKGLGTEFLRHIERTLVLLHLIDIHQDQLARAYETIRTELKLYNPELITRPEIVALTKCEGMTAADIQAAKKSLSKVVDKKAKVVEISAQAHQGLAELLHLTLAMVNRERAKQQAAKPAKEEMPVISLPLNDEAWQVAKTKHGYIVSGKKIERFALRTDFSNEAAVNRLRDILRRQGIIHELKRQGAQAGDQVAIGEQGTLEL